MVDELPQQELLVAWGQIEQQAGLFDGFQGAMSPWSAIQSNARRNASPSGMSGLMAVSRVPFRAIIHPAVFRSLPPER